MNVNAGICPSCNEHILLKKGIPFLICPLCGESISAKQSAAVLQEMCSDPKMINENLLQCIKLEEKFGPSLPLQILAVLTENFPYNEDVAYLTVKMRGYSGLAVKQYLLAFSESKKKVPYADDFLDNAMTGKNMVWGHLFEKYIENRLSGSKQKWFRERIREMRAAYGSKETEERAVGVLYFLYIVCGIVNIALAGLFLFLNWHIIFYVMMALGVLSIEISLMYIYSRNFNEEIEIVGIERALMVAYMCSIVVAVGGVFLGALITI